MTLEIPTEREMKAFPAPADIPATSSGTGWEAQCSRCWRTETFLGVGGSKPALGLTRQLLGAMIGNLRGCFLEDRPERVVIDILTAAMEEVAFRANAGNDASTRDVWMVTGA